MIKWDYNTNDRLNFIKMVIKRDEDENIQSKNGPLRVHRMNSKLQNRKLNSQRMMTNEERTKDDKERSQIWLWKRYGCVTQVPRPWFSSTFYFFSLILSEICFPKVLNHFCSLPCPFMAKIGEKLASQLAQASWWLKPEVTCSPRRAQLAPAS